MHETGWARCYPKKDASAADLVLQKKRELEAVPVRRLRSSVGRMDFERLCMSMVHVIAGSVVEGEDAQADRVQLRSLMDHWLVLARGTCVPPTKLSGSPRWSSSVTVHVIVGPVVEGGDAQAEDAGGGPC